MEILQGLGIILLFCLGLLFSPLLIAVILCLLYITVFVVALVAQVALLIVATPFLLIGALIDTLSGRK